MGGTPPLEKISMNSWYLPHRFIEFSGRRLDGMNQFPQSSKKVLDRIAQDQAEIEDWLQFYAVQAVAWGILFFASIGITIAVVVGADFSFADPFHRESFLVAGGSTIATTLSFFFIIQAHIICIDRPLGWDFPAPWLVNYFRYPHTSNLLIVPIFLPCMQ